MGKTDVLVTYRVGPMQSGMVRIPKEDFTEEKVKAAIKKVNFPKIVDNKTPIKVEKTKCKSIAIIITNAF